MNRFQSSGSSENGGVIIYPSHVYEPAILKAVKKAFKEMEEKKWEYVFFYFDIHSTILFPDYNNTTTELYPDAKEVLQHYSSRKDIVICLYTCSYPDEIKRYRAFFESHGIHFKYDNVNPEVTNTKYGCYIHKPYYNALFEDKAGFDALYDWKALRNYHNV
jgi:hypothetical protein